MKKIFLIIMLLGTLLFLVSCINDEGNPEIILSGGDMRLYVGDQYVEPGCTVKDDIDINLVCKISGDTVDTTTEGEYLIKYNAIDSDGNSAKEETRKVDVLNDEFASSKSLQMTDIADEFIAEVQSLEVYNLQRSDVSYVNIETFINFLSGIIRPLEISKINSEMTIKYTLTSGEESEYSEYTYEMVINLDENTIKTNDIDIVMGLNVDPISDFGSGLSMVNYEVSGEIIPVEIDLDVYNIKTVLKEDDFYMPLYLTNFLFSGFYVNVYEMGDKVFITDYFSELSNLENNFVESQREDISSEVKIETEKFYALVFDYFYGLKEERSVSTYKDVLSNYNFGQTNNNDDFYNKVNDFFLELDDLHTSQHTFGYNGVGVELGFEQIQNPNTKYFKLLTSMNRYSCNTKEEITTEKIGDTYFITVNSFTSKTGELIDSTINKLENYNNIAFDLTCNTGGMIAGVINVLKYMTNEPIPIRNYNFGTMQNSVSYYKGETDVALNKNFYLMTSNVTFSAANLMTSIVKDMNLAVIVGEKSLGGACAVSIVTSPDGTVFQMSSNTGLTNESGELIEDGIVPHYVESSRDNIINKILEIANT